MLTAPAPMKRHHPDGRSATAATPKITARKSSTTPAEDHLDSTIASTGTGSASAGSTGSRPVPSTGRQQRKNTAITARQPRATTSL